MGFTLKTHTCGELRLANLGEEVTLRGFLQYQRMGKFAVLRDFTGKTQILVRDEVSAGLCKCILNRVRYSHIWVR